MSWNGSVRCHLWPPWVVQRLIPHSRAGLPQIILGFSPIFPLTATVQFLHIMYTVHCTVFNTAYWIVEHNLKQLFLSDFPCHSYYTKTYWPAGGERGQNPENTAQWNSGQNAIRP